MGQPRNDVALAVGDQDRGCRRQPAFLEVLGKPRQIEAGENDPGNLALVVLEALGKMYHPLLGRRIDPVISDGEPGLRHCALEKRLIRDRGIRCRLAGAKDPALGIGRPEQAVIGKS